jgi:transposase
MATATAAEGAVPAAPAAVIIAVGGTAAAGGDGSEARKGHDEVTLLRQQAALLAAERQTAQAERDQLASELERLLREHQRLQTRVGELVAQVQELRRASKRQAAPFSKATTTANPNRPGRKAGTAYGRHARRPVPDPDRISRVVEVGLPAACPHCGGVVTLERMACQYQEDLPTPQASEVCRHGIQIGRCQRCRRRIQPRHPEQTSQALGAAGVQVARARWRWRCGRPRGWACRRARPLGCSASPAVAPDATGWHVGGQRAWLWAFAGDGVTVYRIAHSRGFDDATAVLDADDAGVLERDGWAPSRKFTRATHQTCLAQLLRRCGALLEDAKRGQARTPHAVRRILQQALAARDARDTGQLQAAEATIWAERLGAAADKLIAGRTTYPPNRKLLDHLARERAALFTFLRMPGIQATNWRAEHAIRPAVVSRKSWGEPHPGRAECWQVLADLTIPAPTAAPTRGPCAPTRHPARVRTARATPNRPTCHHR